MSDKPQSTQTPAQPDTPRKAATVMLLREGTNSADGATGMEVFMIVRHQNSDVHAGALVFPGGRVDDEDYDLAADTAVFPPLPGVDKMIIQVPPAFPKPTPLTEALRFAFISYAGTGILVAAIIAEVRTVLTRLEDLRAA